MIGEVDLFGVFLPPLLAWVVVAQILSMGLRRLLAAFGLYRFVWHRPLFDFSVLVILTGLVSLVMNRIL
jgi:hypothetical protein